MNINLGAQWEGFISSNVRSGRYLSASEVVREGLRLLQEREQLRQLRLEHLGKDIAKGSEQLDKGEFLELDDLELKSHIEGVKTRGRRQMANEKAAGK